MRRLEQMAPMVYRFALKLAGDAEVASDLAQEALLRAWRGGNRLRQPTSDRVWLLRIVSNLWKDQLRRRHVARASIPTLIGLSARVDSTAPQHSLECREQLEQVMKAIDALPPRQREVLHLHTCEELSISEISTLLEISPSAVKSSLCLARKQLRCQFAEMLEGSTVSVNARKKGGQAP